MKLNLQGFLLADRFDVRLGATMVDVEDGKARDDEHDEECNDLEGDLALLFRREHAIDLLLTRQVNLSLRPHRLCNRLLNWLLGRLSCRLGSRLGSRKCDRSGLSNDDGFNCRGDGNLVIIDIGHFDSSVIVGVINVLIVSLAMVVLRSSLNCDLIIRQIEAQI